MAMPSQPDPRPEAETVRYDIEDGVAWVYFNRPDKRNCMSPKLNRRMLEVLTELEFRDDVQVLVLTGDGRARLAEGRKVIEHFERELIERIPAEHRAHLLPALNAIWR
jgi:trans-feruloyl-CoA hydratase/vanillin synthase